MSVTPIVALAREVESVGSRGLIRFEAGVGYRLVA
jgi:hypothetical protein